MNSRFNLCLLSLVSALSIGACSKSSELTTNTPTATPRTTGSPAAITSTTASPSTSASPFANIDVRLRDLQSKMDRLFSDTWRNVTSNSAQSPVISSVDMRELKDKYVVRVYVPNGDTSKVDAKIDNNTLHIASGGNESMNGSANSERYQETIGFAQPVEPDKMTVDRKENLVVINVPKATSGAVAEASPFAGASATASPETAFSDLDQRIIREMSKMQYDMDQAFHNAFPNDVMNGTNVLRLGTSVNIDDQKDKYVVHFHLPDQNLQDVNVKYQNGELVFTADENKTSSNQSSGASSQTVESGKYEQMITLPGPVKDTQMKVDREGSTVLVTLPKADSNQTS